jgi:hypothetical protein
MATSDNRELCSALAYDSRQHNTGYRTRLALTQKSTVEDLQQAEIN